MTSDQSFQSQQYNIISNEDKGLNRSNLITLSNLSKQEKIEIIQTRNGVPFAKPGFQLQSEGRISLKKYYEEVSEANSLFQSKGYSIKYDTIRKTKL